MKSFLTSVLAAALAFSSCHAAAEAPDSASSLGAGEMPSPEEIMAIMASYAEPGPEHAALEPLIGTFDSTIKSWFDPSGEPVVSTGRMVNHWILGGRFVQGDYTGELMGEPFAGMSITGYDNAQKCYVATWMDTASTMLYPVSTGQREGSMFTFERDYFDMFTGAMSHSREVVNIESNDRQSMQMYSVLPDGNEVLVMNIDYTRVK